MAIPFSHDELEVKRHFLMLAREFHEGSIEEEKKEVKELAYELSAALLYMNAADYLAEYLVKGISQLAREAVNNYYFSVIDVKPPKRNSYNIGESIKQLERYEFPGKAEIIGKLIDVNKARKRVAHEILKTKATDLGSIDADVNDLAKSTEELINLVDNMQLGMPPKSIKDFLPDNTNDSKENT